MCLSEAGNAASPPGDYFLIIHNRHQYRPAIFSISIARNERRNKWRHRRHSSDHGDDEASRRRRKSVVGFIPGRR